jgi:hypothetical protein
MIPPLPIDIQLPQASGSGNPDSPSCPVDLIRPGGPCPECGKGKLDYNGLLELECPACGFRSTGGAGCT